MCLVRYHRTSGGQFIETATAQITKTIIFFWSQTDIQTGHDTVKKQLVAPTVR
jgi:hypothetical protein